jgi:hypothetical protein
MKFMTLMIGISGAARSGKDTLCRSLIREFQKINKQAVRKSLAGDIIKNDLNVLTQSKLSLNCFTENTKEKELLRPLMVEYGKLMRNISQGRYFTSNFSLEPNIINIIPDIRYAEYENDEIYWLKDEMNGFLIFLEREGIDSANETEEENNKKIKIKSHLYLKWNSLDENDPDQLKIIDGYAKRVIKSFTTFQEGNRML